MPENEEVAPAPTAEAQQEAAQASDAKAEDNSTAKASEELSEDDLEAVAGGRQSDINAYLGPDSNAYLAPFKYNPLSSTGARFYDVDVGGLLRI